MASAGLGLSGARCVQDLFSPPQNDVAYTLETALPDSFAVNIGDTLAAPAVQLMADGSPVTTVTFDVAVVSGSSVTLLADGRLAVVGSGNVVVSVSPRNPGLITDTALHKDFVLHPVIPRLSVSGPDTLYSINDTALLQASPLSRTGVPLVITAPVTWTLDSGGVNLQLLDAAAGRIRALGNGDAWLTAHSDSARFVRLVRVRQRAADAGNLAALTLRALGLTRSVTALQAADVRGNAIANANYSWQSRDAAVATVTPSGAVTAVAAGATRVVVTAQGPGGAAASATESTNVTVAPAQLQALPGNWTGTASIGGVLPSPYVVQLVTAAGAVLTDSGITVTFQLNSGDGSFGGGSSIVTRTDTQGRAQAVMTLGLNLDDDSATATGSGLVGSAVRFGAGPAQPVRLAFDQEPSAAAAGAAIAPPIRISVRDTFNTLVSSAPGFANLAIAPGTGTAGAQLLGATQRSLVGGTATFSSVAIDRSGSLYRLIASAPGLGSDTSVLFDIGTGTAARLSFTVQPVVGTTNTPLSPALQVRAEDAFGNPVTSYGGLVSLLLGDNPPGGNVTGTLNVVAAAGVATFSNVRLDRAGNGYTLIAASGTLLGTSQSFSITGAPDTLVKVSGDLQNVIVNQTLPQPFVVEVRDADGITIPGDTIIFIRQTAGGSFGGQDSVKVVTNAQGRAAATFTVGAIAGTYTAQARRRLNAADEQIFTANGSPSGLELEFTTQPTDAQGGVILSPSPVVRVRDGTGATVAGSTAIITLTVVGGTSGAAVMGQSSVAASGGISTFSAVAVDSMGAGYRLVASAGGLAPDTSASFGIATGQPVRLVFRSHPDTLRAGAPGGSAIVAYVADAGGNVIPSYIGGVQLALVTGAGTANATLRGTSNQPLVSGVATFADLSIDSAGTGYRLRAFGLSGIDEDTTGTIAVVAAPPSRLRFVQAPTTTVAGIAIQPAVTVVIEDSLGNAVRTATNAVSVVLGGTGVGQGGMLLGTTTVAPVNGVATLGQLRVRVAGSYTLRAQSSGLTSTPDAAFDVTAAPASRLAFTAQPTDAVTGATLSPAIVVTVQDSTGNTVSPAGNITLALTPSATVSGTTTRAIISGSATFDDLSIAAQNTGYTFTASTSLLPGASAVSAPFAIVATGANRLVWNVVPGPTVTAGQVVASFPIVSIVTAAGAPTSATDQVLVRITSGTGTAGARIYGDSVLNASNGSVTFNNLRFDSAGTGYTLTALATGIQSATTPAFNVVAGAARTLGFQTQPTSRTAGVAFAPAIEIAIRDSVGNLVTSFSDSITLAITAGTGPAGATLAGTTRVPAAGGTATFPGVSIATAGTGYSLTASRSGLTPAVSGTFSIAAGSPSVMIVSPSGTTIPVGGTQDVTATLQDAFGNTLSGASITWSSMTPTLVSMSGATATGVAPGQTAIRASSSGIDGYATVTVTTSSITPVNLWVPMTSGTGLALIDVWATTSGNDVLAVGNNVLRFNGSSWNTVYSGGGSYRGVGGSSPSSVHVVGLTTPTLFYDGASFASLAGPTDFSAVWAASPPDAFAGAGQGGDIYRFQNGTWVLQAQDLGDPGSNVTALWGFASNDVFAGVYGNYIRRWNGTTWSPMTNTSNIYVNGLWGPSTSNVFAVGRDGELARFNGSAWSELSSPVPVDPGRPPVQYNMHGVHGTSGSDVYAVGDGGTILRFDGTGWSLMTSGTSQSLFGVHATGTDVYAVGGAGTVLRGVRGATLAVTPATETLTGGAPTRQLAVSLLDGAAQPISGLTPTFTSSDTTTATVSASGLVTAVRSGTALVIVTAGALADTVAITVTLPVVTVDMSLAGVSLSGAGSTQQLTATPRDQFARAVPGAAVSWNSENGAVATASGTGLVQAVAVGQTIITATSSGVSGTTVVTIATPGLAAVNLLQPTSFTGRSLGVAGFAAGNVVAVGDASVARRFDGTSWNDLTPAAPVSEQFNRVWGPGPATLFVTGTRRTLLRHTGTWTTISQGSGFDPEFIDVWGASSTNVLVTDAQGVVQRFDGAGLQPFLSQGVNRGIWGSSANDVFIVGNGGEIRHYDGTICCQLVTPTASDLADVWGTGPNQVFAVGSGGAILRYTGSWATMTSNTTANLVGVWGTSGNDVFAIGSNTIARYNGSTWDTLPGVGTPNLYSVAGSPGGDVFFMGTTSLRGYRGASVTALPASANLQLTGTTTQQLAVTARDASSTVIAGVTFGYVSTNTGVATVNGTGLITAVAVGNANIIVSAPGGAADTVPVSVTPAAIARIAISPDSGTISSIGGIRSNLIATAYDAGNNPINGVTFSWSSLNTAIAAVNASSGQVTGVSSGQVTVAASSGGQSGYALIRVFDSSLPTANVWVSQASPVTQSMNAVWAPSASVAFAVGSSGTILQRTGTSWSSMPSIPTTRSLYGVWGLNDTTVFAAGGSSGNPVMLSYNGSAWTLVATPAATTITALWGSGPADIWAGSTGKLLRFNGTSWDSVPGVTSQSVNAIFGFGPTSVFIGGSNGMLKRYNGTTWVDANTGLSGTYNTFSIWGTSPTNLYAAGSTGVVYRYDGTTWTQESISGAGFLTTVHGVSSTNITATGSTGRVNQYNGSTWSVDNGAVATQFIEDVFVQGAGGEAIGVVSTSALLLRGIRGGTVTVAPSSRTFTSLSDTVTLTATVRDAAGNALPGAIVNWSSSDPAVASVNSSGLVSASGNGSATITATAIGGASGSASITVAQTAYTIVPQFTATGGQVGGSTTSIQAIALDSLGSSIAGATFTWTSGNIAIATVTTGGTTTTVTQVGNGQTWIRAERDGRSGYVVHTVTNSSLSAVNLWAPMTSGVTTQLNGIWGTSPTNIFAVGNNGLIMQYNGSTWSSTNVGSANLNDIWGSDGTSIYAVGASGTVLRYSGAWTSLSGSTANLQSVWLGSPIDGYMLGSGSSWARFNASGVRPLSNGVASASMWGSFNGLLRSVTGILGSSSIVSRFNVADSSWVTDSTFTPGGFIVLNGIWGTATNETYAVGGVAAAAGATQTPRIIRRSLTSWSTISATITGTARTLNAVNGGSSTDIYMVGDSGTVLRYNATTFANHRNATTQDLNAVWASPNGDVFAVGDNGTILRGYRGATISVAPSSRTFNALGHTQALTATGPGGVSLTGMRWSSSNAAVATVDSISGLVTAIANGSATITGTAPGGASNTSSITVSQVAASISVAPTAGTAGTTFTATVRDSASNVMTASVTWATLNTNVATISSGGLVSAVASSSGQSAVSATFGSLTDYALVTISAGPANPLGTVTDVPVSSSLHLNAVYAFSSNSAIVVGDTGISYGISGTTAGQIGSTGGRSLYGVWGIGGGVEAIAVGAGGTILRLTGSTWTPITSGKTANLRAVWLASPNLGFVGGDEGSLLRLTRDPATNAFAVDSFGTIVPTGQSIRTIWGRSKDSVWAGASGGQIWFYNGSTWTSQNGGTLDTIQAIAGNATQVFHVSGRSAAGGHFGQRSGGSWTIVNTLSSLRPPRGLWVPTSTSQHTVGWSNPILLRPGSGNWTNLSGTNHEWHGIHGVGSGAYVVGQLGEIRRLTP